MRRKIFVNNLSDLFEASFKYKSEIIEHHFTYIVITDKYKFVFNKFN